MKSSNLEILKQLILLLCFLFLLVSCTSEESVVPNSDFAVEDVVLKSFVNTTMAARVDGKIALLASKESILNAAKNYSNKYRLGIEPIDMKVLELDDKAYLRIMSKDGKVSTIELTYYKDKGTYQTGSTLCTSSDCSEGGGCLPNGQYCTKCRPNPSMPDYKGDCTRTTGGPETPVVEITPF